MGADGRRRAVLPGRRGDGAPLELTGDTVLGVHLRGHAAGEAGRGRAGDLRECGADLKLEAEGLRPRRRVRCPGERKNAGIADRIDLSLTVPIQSRENVETWRDMIAAETLALSLTVGLSP